MIFKGHIYAKNMPLDSRKFPKFLPIGEYRMDSRYSTYMNGKEEFIMLLQDYIEVKALGILEF